MLPGSSSMAVMTVAAAPVSLWVERSPSMISADIRGGPGEDDNGLGIADEIERRAQGPTRAVWLRLGDGLDAIREGRAEMSRSGDTIAAILPAPAARAARIGQATIGRPQTGWSIFGSEERMRVPHPPP